MSTAYRALCAELVELSAPTDSIPQLAERLQKLSELASRARAALAQPELCNLHREMVAESVARSARAALAQPEPVAPTDEELISPIVWMIDDCVYDNDKGEIAQSLRELIARWGTPAINTSQED
jgi:hypothetical protein